MQKVNNVNVKEIKTYFGLAPNDSKQLAANGSKQLVAIIQQRRFSSDDLAAMTNNDDEIESLHVHLNKNLIRDNKLAVIIIN